MTDTVYGAGIFLRCGLCDHQEVCDWKGQEDMTAHVRAAHNLVWPEPEEGHEQSG